jgi:tryptophanyl-tRNA synthetase
MESKLIEQFGCDRITPQQLQRIERLTSEPAHPFLRRGLFVSHRDLDKILDDYEHGRPFYIYTGRGPSAGSLHLGHLVPFMFTQYLQRVFGAQVVIQITDDEKFLVRDCSLEQVREYGEENIKDIIACGFDPSKTFIFTNLNYIGTLYPNILQIQSRITNSQAFSTFGIEMSDNIGKTSFSAIQAAPAFSTSFPHLFGDAKMRCLIPQGLDQDPYFRLTRDVAPRLHFPKPSLLHSTMLPSLRGVGEKMSASVNASAVFLNDTPNKIRKKINASVSGGCEQKEEQLVKGANLEVDVAYQYLKYFLEDDVELERIATGYGDHTLVRPKLLTGVVKKRCIEVLSTVVREHQMRRSTLTPEFIEQFTRVDPPQNS